MITIPKIQTWWRIQRRMAVIYLAEIYVALEWPICLLVNWIIFFSIPIWIGPIYMFLVLVRAIQSRKNVERKVLTGRIWFWDSYRIY